MKRLYLRYKKKCTLEHESPGPNWQRILRQRQQKQVFQKAMCHIRPNREQGDSEKPYEREHSIPLWTTGWWYSPVTRIPPEYNSPASSLSFKLWIGVSMAQIFPQKASTQIKSSTEWFVFFFLLRRRGLLCANPILCRLQKRGWQQGKTNQEPATFSI